MVSEYGLKEIFLPLSQDVTDESGEAKFKGPFNNIFVSDDWDTCERLMLLIQGSGAVRAGQWARALCINDDLSIGSILPYLKKIKQAKYGVIVFNPNLNSAPEVPETIKRSSFLTTSKIYKQPLPEIRIPGSESNTRHVRYVWERFADKSKAKTIAIVAHSAGGACTHYLISKIGEQMSQRVCGVAFTDSVHGVSPSDKAHVKHFIQKRCRNWVKSDEPLDTKIAKPSYDCLQVSAGHEKHEYTSGTAIESVFEYLFLRQTLFEGGEDPTDKNYDGMSDSSSSADEMPVD